MKSEKGFTLLEVILAVGIFAIVAIPIVSMFLDSIKITSKSENTSEAYSYAQQYVEKLKGGEIEVKEVVDETIESTEYKYSIAINSTTSDIESDGDDFYKYMNEENSCLMTLSDSALQINTSTNSSFDSIKIDENCDWVVNDTTVSVKKDKIWLQYGDLTSQKTLTIDNQSGQKLNIYLQWTGSDESKKNNIKIKNIGGIINVYGPIKEIPENRGRKKSANVTVTVKNGRTGEHAELTANVVYYEVENI